MNARSQILLIEDDPAIAQSLRTALEREGFNVVWKAAGGEGIRHAQKTPPHLILLDVRLPDGSGFDFCRQMRQMGLHQPILMLTVQHEEMDKVLGLEMGADDYVTKPFNLRELMARIRAQLRRAYGELSSTDANLIFIGDLMIDLTRSQVTRGSETLNLTPTEFRMLVYMARLRVALRHAIRAVQGSDEPIFTVGDLRVYLAYRRVFVGEKEVHLTPIEYQLLLMLIQYAGKVVTRRQLLHDVWGPEYVDESHYLRIYMGQLRHKLEADPTRTRYLITEPGVGYLLKTD